MARPSQPLIKRDDVFRTALAIIDEVGIEDFGLDRLADELNVRAPSLYHHFQGKAEILAGVARMVTLDVRVPREPEPEKWQEWFIELAMRFRRSVLRHPRTAPLLVQYFPRRFALDAYDTGASLMTRAGVPPELHTMIMEGLDYLAFGGALIESARRVAGITDVFPTSDGDHPALAASAAANVWDEEEMFRESVRTFLRGITNR